MSTDGITASQMQEIIARLTGQLNVTMESMVTLAGAAIAEVALTMRGADGEIGILAGPGNTGAVALAAANRLHGWDIPVIVRFATDRARANKLTTTLADRLELANGHVYEPGAPLPRAALWIDGIYGIGFHEPMNDDIRSLIDDVNHAGSPILAIDTPTGLDATTGKASLPTIRADRTVTMGYPKLGLLKPYAAQLVGELWLADLGIPSVVWQQYHLNSPAFRGQSVMRWNHQ